MRLHFAAAILATTCVGCRPDYKAQIESNTAWRGQLGGATVEGVGNQTVDLPDRSQCCSLLKRTEDGYLRVRIVSEGGGILNPRDSDWVVTTAAFGSVSVCGE